MPSVKVFPALPGQTGDVSIGVGGASPWPYTVPATAPGAYEYPVTELRRVQLVPTKLNALHPLVLSQRARHDSTSGTVALLTSIGMPYISDMSSESSSGFAGPGPDNPLVPDSSESSTGFAGPGPDNPPVSDSSDSSLPVVEGAGAVLLVLGRTSIITAEGEGTAAVLEGELEEDISLISEVSISSPS
jgi:hypothetical protein